MQGGLAIAFYRDFITVAGKKVRNHGGKFAVIFNKKQALWVCCCHRLRFNQGR